MFVLSLHNFNEQGKVGGIFVVKTEAFRARFWSGILITTQLERDVLWNTNGKMIWTKKNENQLVLRKLVKSSYFSAFRF